MRRKLLRDRRWQGCQDRPARPKPSWCGHRRSSRCDRADIFDNQIRPRRAPNAELLCVRTYLSYTPLVQGSQATRRVVTTRQDWRAELCDLGLAGARPSICRSGYLVRSAAVGGPSTQFTSHGPSTVMNVNEFAGSQASWTIFAGM